MKKSLLKNYAKLIAVVGGNIRKGQTVEIFAEPDQPEFITMLCEECYKAGAKSVRIIWSSQELDRLAARFESQKTLSSVASWEEELLKDRCENLPVRIKIISSDPDGMKGVDSEKVSKANSLRSLIVKPYNDKMTNRFQWCIAAVPSIKNISRRASKRRRRKTLATYFANVESNGKRSFNRLDVA